MLYEITSIRYTERSGNPGEEKTDEASRKRIGSVLEIRPEELIRVPEGANISIPYVLNADRERITGKVLCPSPIVKIHIRNNGIILLETKNSVYEFSAYEEAGRSHITVTVHQ